MCVSLERTLKTCGPFHDSFRGTVALDNQTKECAAVSFYCFRVHLTAWAGRMKGAFYGLTSVWHWLKGHEAECYEQSLGFHECWELVLGQVVKDPERALTLLYLLLPHSLQFTRVITLLPPTQNLYGGTQSQMVSSFSRCPNLCCLSVKSI